jgi:beta-lactamase class A
MKSIILIVLTFFFLINTTAQKPDNKLRKKVIELIRGFHGDIGIYIKNLKTGKTVAINADTVFPTASMIKVPILLGVIDQINKGTLNYHQPLIYTDSLLYEGEDILGSFKNNERIELSKLILLMLSTSDNTASLWLQSLAGTGIHINQLLDNLGFVSTRVNSRTAGRESYRSVYGWGQTTPKEMATMIERIYKKEIFNKQSSEQMMRLLGRNYWDEEGLSQVPPTIEVFSKNGAVNASRSEVMLVNAPHRPYVFCIITKNNKDVSWQKTNEAWVLTKKLSLLLWNYFEPRSKDE